MKRIMIWLLLAFAATTVNASTILQSDLEELRPPSGSQTQTTVKPGSTRLQPLKPAAKRICCYTYMDAKMTSDKTTGNPQNDGGTLVSACKPGDVLWSVNEWSGDEGVRKYRTIYGYYCAHPTSDCTYVDQNKTSTKIQDSSGNWITVNCTD